MFFFEVFLVFSKSVFCERCFARGEFIASWVLICLAEISSFFRCPPNKNRHKTQALRSCCSDSSTEGFCSRSGRTWKKSSLLLHPLSTFPTHTP